MAALVPFKQRHATSWGWVRRHTFGKTPRDGEILRGVILGFENASDDIVTYGPAAPVVADGGC